MTNVPRSMPGRRRFLRDTAGGLGGLAMAHLFGSQGLLRGAEIRGNPQLPRATHFPPRAKRVIWLFMHGGPSHLDLFDPKPELIRLAGQPLPESFGEVKTRRKVAQNPLLPPLMPFRPRGRSGLEISDFLPHLAGVADELCVVRSCHGDSVNHPQSVYQMNTGSILMGKPSVGSWVAYGLGSENDSLPAFLVMPDPGSGPKGGPPAWGSGFLPATYQGTTLRPGPVPILDLAPPEGFAPPRGRRVLDLTQALNRVHWEAAGHDDELKARIDAAELAFRMQAAAPELVDISGESRSTRALYGIDDPATREFGTRCLMARRLIERGVRFVQLYSGDTNGWDAHDDVLKNHTEFCGRTDRPAAGLIRDLRQRGLLDDTLVVWGGEFGRMPMSEKGKGRDHNPWGYSVVLAGGGVKGGYAHGATDVVGLRAERDPVHVHDLHATMLHLLGLDHERLVFPVDGRTERLTNVFGNVVTDLLA